MHIHSDKLPEEKRNALTHTVRKQYASQIPTIPSQPGQERELLSAGGRWWTTDNFLREPDRKAPRTSA